MNKRLKYGFITVASFLVIILVGVTYAFFNYTRTSTANNVRVGNIYFSSNQGTTINLTNMFPMAGREAENANLDTITISLQGNTNYSGGEEFVVSIDELNNGYNNDGYHNVRVPISYLATYEATNGNSIGILSNDYWNDRNSSESSIYYLPSHGVLSASKKLLVGYIAPGETGINGTLTIKAYIDASKIAITDTYSELGYEINHNLTTEEADDCATFIADDYGVSQSVAREYCFGTGSIYGWTFEEDLPYYIEEDEGFNYLLSHNILIDLSDSMGTSSSWVSNRKLLTTEEWNYFSTHPISFKIRVESREGIWVNGTGTIDSCEGCKYIYTTNDMYTTWNTMGKTPTTLNSGYSDNYFDVIESTGRDYFLGLKLNNSNKITNVYSCGVKDSVPFCFEIARNGSAYQTNKSLLQSIWGNACTVSQNSGGESMECGTWDGSLPFGSFISSDGTGSNGPDYNNDCGGVFNGRISCIESNN